MLLTTKFCFFFSCWNVFFSSSMLFGSIVVTISSCWTFSFTVFRVLSCGEQSIEYIFIFRHSHTSIGNLVSNLELPERLVKSASHIQKSDGKQNISLQVNVNVYTLSVDVVSDTAAEKSVSDDKIIFLLISENVYKVAILFLPLDFLCEL